MRRLLACVLAGTLFAGAVSAAPLRPSVVNEAALGSGKIKTGAVNPAVLRAQVLLDRLRFSPGVIDGRLGDNVREAIRAFEESQGLAADGVLDSETFARLVAASPEAAIVEHRLISEDVKGPFRRKLPTKMEEMADLDALPYRSPLEKLAERFHTSESILKALNPAARFDVPGGTIMVPAVRGEPRKNVVSRIEVDKPGRRLRAFDEAGALVAVYPASIGSEEKPAPSGTHHVRAVAKNPTYTYNPDFKFKGVKAEKPFEVPPGPNNPVGVVWIDLSVETYGIHGAPEPERVGKAFSNGCVRLTNWDALDLAAMLRRKAQVAFSD